MKRSIKNFLTFENAEYLGKRDQLIYVYKKTRLIVNCDVFSWKIDRDMMQGFTRGFLKKWVTDNLIQYVKLSGQGDHFIFLAFQDCLGEPLEEAVK